MVAKAATSVSSLHFCDCQAPIKHPELQWGNSLVVRVSKCPRLHPIISLLWVYRYEKKKPCHNSNFCRWASIHCQSVALKFCPSVCLSVCRQSNVATSCGAHITLSLFILFLNFFYVFYFLSCHIISVGVQSHTKEKKLILSSCDKICSSWAGRNTEVLFFSGIHVELKSYICIFLFPFHASRSFWDVGRWAFNDFLLTTANGVSCLQVACTLTVPITSRRP